MGFGNPFKFCCFFLTLFKSLGVATGPIWTNDETCKKVIMGFTMRFSFVDP